MNHRIFERTLRPLVFWGACLFERHYNPQALLGIGLALRGLPQSQWRRSLDPKQSKYVALLTGRVLACQQPPIFKVDLGSGRDTR